MISRRLFGDVYSTIVSINRACRGIMVLLEIIIVNVDRLCCHWEISHDWLRDYSTFERYHLVG